LSQADLIGADLSEAKLKGADLWKVDLRGAKLFKVDFSDTNLDSTNFRYADLERARFTGSNIQYSIIPSPVIDKKDIHEIKKEKIVDIINDIRNGNIDEEILTNIFNNLNLL